MTSPIIRRTETGNWAAYNAGSALPRKMRQLLLMINGVTELNLYRQSLAAYGDVDGLIESLLEAGLVEISGGAFTKAERKEPVAEQRPAPRAKPASGFARTEFGPTESASTHMLSTLMANDADTEHSRQSVSGAVRLMRQFVHTHLGEQAPGILPQLDAIQNADDLAATLWGYEHVIARVGPAAQQHMIEINLLLLRRQAVPTGTAGA
jgi:hypothetical protein